MTHYFLKRGQKIVGPFKLEQLEDGISKGQLTLTDSFSKSRNGPWYLLSQLEVNSHDSEDEEEEDWLRHSSNAATTSSTTPTPPKEVKTFLPLPSGLPVVIISASSIGLLIGLFVGFLIWGMGDNDLSQKSIALKKSSPPSSALKNDANQIPSEKTDLMPEGQKDSPTKFAESISANKTNTQDAPTSIDLAGSVNHSETIKKLLDTFFNSFGVSIKKTYSLCIQNEDALELLGTFSWGEEASEAILSFPNFPSEDLLSNAATKSESVEIPLKYNGKDRRYFLQFVDHEWRIDYVKVWKEIHGVNKEFPVYVSVLIYRNPNKRFKQIEVSLIVSNNTAQDIEITGKCRNPVTTASILGPTIRPGKSETIELYFGAQEMLVPAAEEGQIALECEVFPRVKSGKLYKKYYNVKFIVEKNEADKLAVICEQPYEVMTKN